jgi:hypothetical protein
MSQSIDDFRKEAKERGAFEVVDGQGGGFSQHEDDFANPALEEFIKNDTQLAKEMSEIEDRQKSIKPPQSHVELARQMYEQNMNTEVVRECQWLRQDEITQFVPGTMMNHEQFLQKLKIIRPDAHYNNYIVLGRIGLNVVNPFRLKPYFVTTCQAGQMIEWSQMRVDEHNIPTNEKYRGWRTVLMTCIEKEIITVEDCGKVFGKPTGDRANRWYRQLYILRNSRCPECLKQVCTCKTLGDDMRADKYKWTPVA